MLRRLQSVVLFTYTEMCLDLWAKQTLRVYVATKVTHCLACTKPSIASQRAKHYCICYPLHVSVSTARLGENMYNSR